MKVVSGHGELLRSKDGSKTTFSDILLSLPSDKESVSTPVTVHMFEVEGQLVEFETSEMLPFKDGDKVVFAGKKINGVLRAEIMKNVDRNITLPVFEQAGILLYIILIFTIVLVIAVGSVLVALITAPFILWILTRKWFSDTAKRMVDNYQD